MLEQFSPTLTEHASAQTDVLHNVQNKMSDCFNFAIDNELDYSRLAKRGVNPNTINRLLNYGFVKKETNWIIPQRTLSHRLKNNESLTRDEGAKVIRTLRICAMAETVFASSEKAKRWLAKSKKSLNGLSPKEAIQDEFGANQVEKLLMAIDEGYF